MRSFCANSSCVHPRSFLRYFKFLLAIDMANIFSCKILIYLDSKIVWILVIDKKVQFCGQEKPKRMDKDKKEPVILITNDDGITAPGIKNLIEAVKDLGKVVVVAPDKPQSGMGHAITIGVPLRLHKVNFFENIEAY